MSLLNTENNVFCLHICLFLSLQKSDKALHHELRAGHKVDMDEIINLLSDASLFNNILSTCCTKMHCHLALSICCFCILLYLSNVRSYKMLWLRIRNLWASIKYLTDLPVNPLPAMKILSHLKYFLVISFWPLFGLNMHTKVRTDRKQLWYINCCF